MSLPLTGFYVIHSSHDSMTVQPSLLTQAFLSNYLFIHWCRHLWGTGACDPPIFTTICFLDHFGIAQSAVISQNIYGLLEQLLPAVYDL